MKIGNNRLSAIYASQIEKEEEKTLHIRIWYYIVLICHPEDSFRQKKSKSCIHIGLSLGFGTRNKNKDWHHTTRCSNLANSAPRTWRRSKFRCVINTPPTYSRTPPIYAHNYYHTRTSVHAFFVFSLLRKVQQRPTFYCIFFIQNMWRKSHKAFLQRYTLFRQSIQYFLRKISNIHLWKTTFTLSASSPSLVTLWSIWTFSLLYLNAYHAMCSLPYLPCVFDTR